MWFLCYRTEKGQKTSHWVVLFRDCLYIQCSVCVNNHGRPTPCVDTDLFILQLREELQRAKQTHSGEVEGMRKEVSKLTAELHQRDLTIATLKVSSPSIKQQLCSEVEQAQQKAPELKVSKGTGLCCYCDYLQFLTILEIRIKFLQIFPFD